MLITCQKIYNCFFMFNKMPSKNHDVFTGNLILVVGNSGSGKDSIIQGALERIPNQYKKPIVPKRYITRPSSKTEKNISITPKQFKKMVKENKFALKWHIYGLYYGIPISVEEALKNGDTVVINVSRKIIKKAKKKYPNVKVVFIKVPLEITIERLKQRQRESKKGIKKRIKRAKKFQVFSHADYIVDNSGKLEDAVNQFLNYLLKYLKKK